VTYFLSGFFVAFMQRMRSIRSWLILLLIPALVLGMQAALPEEQISAPVLVGVALPEDGGEDFWELLDDRSGTVLTFLSDFTTGMPIVILGTKWPSITST